MLAQLAAAVEYIHDKKILHRDIKPSNVLVKANVLKLGDFGLAKTLDNALSQANTSVGTSAFIAPEVLLGESYGRAADIFSLGSRQPLKFG